MSKVKVYSTDYCPYCHAVKNLLKAKGVDFEEINVEGDDKTREWLVEQSGQTTVPQVFIDEKPYGGFTDIEALDRSGELDKILS